MTYKKIMLQGTKRLQDVGIDTAQLDAKILLKYVTGLSDVDLVIHGDEEMSEKHIHDLNTLITRRAQFEPVAYIIGRKEFWGLEFKVTPDTLIPRPASELFIEAALEHFEKPAPLRILDLGTGSGCLILTLLHEFKNATGIGVDLSSKALAIAQENAQLLDLETRVNFIESEWCKNVEGQFDLIISNPPYIPPDEKLMPDVQNHEPHSALFAENNGLMAYETLIPQLKRHSHSKTKFFCEIGQGQVEEIRLLLRRYNFEILGVKKDIQSIKRLIVSCFLTVF